MKFSITYPLTRHPFNPEFVSKAGLKAICDALERSGFDGLGFTDHPAPTARWLAAGGHDALDPFAALAFCAALTDRIRLIPNIVVLPYRNPFLVAKAVATIDVLSGGRFTLAVGAGYMRGEYRALGVDFDARNEIFDDALEVIRQAWTEDDINFVGHGFEAKGQSANPKPATLPPIWIGGNSKLSRRRVATVADGWCPFPAPRTLASTAKTPPLETADDLAAMLDDLWKMVDEAGRDPQAIDVSFGTPAGGSPADDAFNADEHQQGLDDLAAIGVTWAGVSVPDDSVQHAVETIERYGREVIAPLRGSAS